MTRRCPGCARELPATTKFFPVDRSTASGLRSRCKRCQKDRSNVRTYGRVVDGMKVCPGCGERQPYDEEHFPIKRRRAHPLWIVAATRALLRAKITFGTFAAAMDVPPMLTALKPSCRECVKRYAREYYAVHREIERPLRNARYKAKMREDPVFALDKMIDGTRARARVDADPAKRAEIREVNRMERMARARREGRPARKSRASAPRDGGGRALDVAPLREHLRRILVAEGIWDEGRARTIAPREPESTATRTFEQAASDMGTNDRNLRDMIQGRTGYVTLGVADRILCALGSPHLLYEFWPEMDRPERLPVGTKESVRVILPHYDRLTSEEQARAARRIKPMMPGESGTRSSLTRRKLVSRDVADVIWAAVREHDLRELEKH